MPATCPPRTPTYFLPVSVLAPTSFLPATDILLSSKPSLLPFAYLSDLSPTSLLPLSSPHTLRLLRLRSLTSLLHMAWQSAHASAWPCSVADVPESG
eukprot:2333400-Rhodomonas_salina.2